MIINELCVFYWLSVTLRKEERLFSPFTTSPVNQAHNTLYFVLNSLLPLLRLCLRSDLREQEKAGYRTECVVGSEQPHLKRGRWPTVRREGRKCGKENRQREGQWKSKDRMKPSKHMTCQNVNWRPGLSCEHFDSLSSYCFVYLYFSAFCSKPLFIYEQDEAWCFKGRRHLRVQPLHSKWLCSRRSIQGWWSWISGGTLKTYRMEFDKQCRPAGFRRKKNQTKIIENYYPESSG